MWDREYWPLVNLPPANLTELLLRLVRQTDKTDTERNPDRMGWMLLGLVTVIAT